MQIERVHVRAFGPFQDRSIELAPGLTVVFGPNEAGKSTWHAALYAGLCGLRRGQGATGEDRDFVLCHRPWGGGDWQASVIVRLADGRRVEIRQDLERKIECGARDLVLGLELSGEIINKGTPDGSRWLGLDRRTFLATACVRQADVLEVLQSASALQEHLQRAAATGGADETAAAALTLLEKFESDHVGRDQANSIRPLHRSKVRVDEAATVLQDVRAEHERYLGRLEQADRREAEAVTRERERAAFEAALCRHRAAAGRRSFDRAQELHARLPVEDPPPLSAEDDLSRKVAAALAGHQAMPPPVVLEGPSTVELAAELESVPPMPEGDLDPHPIVTAALADWRVKDQTLAIHDEGQPAHREGVGTSAPTSTMRGLAAELDAASASRLRTNGRAFPLWTGLAVGGVTAAAGVVLVVAGRQALGLAALVPGALLVTATALVMVLRMRNTNLDQVRATEVGRRRSEAEASARALGLPTEPALLRQLADRADAFALHQRQVESWLSAREGLARAWSEAVAALEAALLDRGAAPGPDLMGSYGAYEAACRKRTAQSRAASRRLDLEDRIAQRAALEAHARRTALRRQEASSALRAAAERCHISGLSDDALVEGLCARQREHSGQLERRQDELGDRAELHALLGDGTLEDLGTRVAQEERRAADLVARFDPLDLDAIPLDDDADRRLANLTRAATEARASGAEAHGEVITLASQLRSVAAAEEELAAARAELGRVEALADTLRMTRGFLERAEEQVHRDVAPRLKRKLEKWLPRITKGRYVEAIVTPESLRVQVRAAEGEWRDAARLSQGTREQIYLLLRLALVEHLGNPAEPCPLVLDEVTVQSDAARTEALLDLVHEISGERQVVLFSQENEVLAWAEQRLAAPEDRLVVLDVAEVPA